MTAVLIHTTTTNSLNLLDQTNIHSIVNVEQSLILAFLNKKNPNLIKLTGLLFKRPVAY